MAQDPHHGVLFDGEQAGKLQVVCYKCRQQETVFAKSLDIACDMLNEKGWFLEQEERLVCPKCPGVRPVYKPKEAA